MYKRKKISINCSPLLSINEQILILASLCNNAVLFLYDDQLMQSVDLFQICSLLLLTIIDKVKLSVLSG